MIAFVSAVACSLVLTPLVAAAAARWKLVDVPNHRSLHEHAVPRGGGVAVLLASVVGVAAADRWSIGLVALAVGATALGLVGLVDDRAGLPAIPRLVAQLVVPLVTIVPVVGLARIELILLVPVVVLFAAGFVNAFNFMDGINGISGFQAAVIGIALGAYCSRVGAGALAAAGWAVAGASVGFLPLNAVRPRLFLGDVGSYFLGFWLAGLATLSVQAGVPVLVVGAPFMLYVADTSLVLIRRWRRGESLTEAHREHAYQRIVQLGYSHLAVASTCALLSAFCAGLMWLLQDASDLARAAGFGACLMLIFAYLWTPTALQCRANRRLANL